MTPSQAVAKLRSTQKQVTKGAAAREERDATAFWLWTHGWSFAEITAVLDETDRANGGRGVSASTVGKSISRHRRPLEADLLNEALNR
jgi:hypothetical protein